MFDACHVCCMFHDMACQDWTFVVIPYAARRNTTGQHVSNSTASFLAALRGYNSAPLAPVEYHIIFSFHDYTKSQLLLNILLAAQYVLIRFGFLNALLDGLNF